MKLGIFGGTFDPPHIAHLVLAEEARIQLEVDSVLWVVTADPPHKQGQPITTLEARLQMAQAAISGNPGFQLSRVDIDRPPPHYALDTVSLLRQQYPGSDLIYLMGADSLHDLPGWHRPRNFIQACDGIGVLRRPGFQPDLTVLEEQFPGLVVKLRWIESPLLEISSTDIRHRAAEGRSFRYFVPEPVYHLIQEMRLYRQ